MVVRLMHIMAAEQRLDDALQYGCAAEAEAAEAELSRLQRAFAAGGVETARLLETAAR